MKPLLARLPLWWHDKALKAFDAWVFHPNHAARMHRVVEWSKLIFCFSLMAGAIYVICHTPLPIDGPREGWRLIANALILACGAMAAFYVGIAAFFKGSHVFFERQGAHALYIRAYDAARNTGEDGVATYDSLFVQRCQALDTARTMQSLCRVEWWMATALWNEGRRRTMRKHYYEQVLPPANTSAATKPRL